jgi:NADH dehydrogenase FAD-containing subunit
MANTHRGVIIGGGFAGLYAVQSLNNAPLRVTLIERRNFISSNWSSLKIGFWCSSRGLELL